MKFLKKILAFIKLAIIGVVWSYAYLCGTVLLFKSVWDFNYLSASNWRVISAFWNEGGRIRSGSDYLFVICLLLLIPLWLWGWRKLYKMSWVQLFILPVTWYQKLEAKNYLKSISRIKINNIGISVGDEIKQDFENKLKQQQSEIENSPKVSQNIRTQINNRLKHRP